MPLGPGFMFNFTCFNVEDPDDPDVGLYNGELSIPGNLLRREVFDPVVSQVRFLFRLCSHPTSSRFLFLVLRVLCIPVWLNICCDAGTWAHRRPNEESEPAH
jgi:hypothetical protein